MVLYQLIILKYNYSISLDPSSYFYNFTFSMLFSSSDSEHKVSRNHFGTHKANKHTPPSIHTVTVGATLSS